LAYSKRAESAGDEAVVLPDVQRFSSPALAVVEKEIHKRLTTSRLNPAEIELIEAPIAGQK